VINFNRHKKKSAIYKVGKAKFRPRICYLVNFNPGKLSWEMIVYIQPKFLNHTKYSLGICAYPRFRIPDFPILAFFSSFHPGFY